ncbi:MAG: AAA family ATPase [Alphaproteobacteria bacterium]|nr:AAA family ATPase [Alphaproteobacteria bacterium]
MDAGGPLSFGPFRVDAQEQRLWRDGVAVPVTRKSFALLAALLARPGRLVTKTELFDTVWHGASVSDAALSRCIRELRVALGDDAATPRYIETAHGRGFRFVAPVSAMPGAAAPPASAVESPMRRRPLIAGRAEPLRRLAAALEAARGGQRQTVFVTGEPGIGKTALVEAFLAAKATPEVAWVAQGRCVEQYGAGEAYLPILEALEHLSHVVGAARLRGVLERYAPAWLTHLPWLAHDAPPAVLERALSGVTPQRMLREIVHALEILASEHPVVLWLEDLHWSDRSSLDVLAFLAGRAGEARLLVVATYRPVENLAPDAALRGLRQELQLRGQSQEIALPLLGRDDVAGYLTARFATADDDTVADLAQLLHRRTEGNALFMVTVVDDLVRCGDIDGTDAGWRALRPIADIGAAIPDSLRQLVEGQFDRLSPDERETLEVAAVAGAAFSAAALAAGLQRETDRVEQTCSALARQGRFLQHRAPIVWPDGTLATGYRFLHALYRQAIYERVPAARRSELHRRIGEREERAYGDKAGSIAAELAIHFEAARDDEKCLRHLAQAGHNALARHAYLEGGDLLAHALTLLDRLPAPDRERRELDLLLPLGAALMAAKGYAAAEVERTYTRAVALARESGDTRRLVRALKGAWNVALVRAELDKARALAKDLLAHAGTDLGLRFDAHAKLGQTEMHRGDLDGARRHLDEALALLDPASTRLQPNEAPRVAAYLAWVLWFQGEPDRALARGQEALARAADLGNPHSSAFALGFVAWLHGFRGEADRLRALSSEQRVLAGEHGLGYWLTWSRFSLGHAATMEGDVALGLREMRAALAAYRATGAEVGVAHFLCTLAQAHLQAGQVEECAARLDEAERLIVANGNRYLEADIHRVRGEMLARGGAGDAARRRAEACNARACDIARAQGNRALELRALVSGCRLRGRRAAATGDRERLASALAGFREGADTRDVRDARTLLAELASTAR